MRRIGILTAGGDTPALNATLYGAVTRANQRKVEVFGFIKGFSSLFNPRVPHVPLNPLFSTIPELDPTYGGTMLGASRDYVDADDKNVIDMISGRLKKLGIDLAAWGKSDYVSRGEEYVRSQEIAAVAMFHERDGLLVPSARSAEANLVILTQDCVDRHCGEPEDLGLVKF